MTLSGILSSPSQRRSFLLATGGVLALAVIAVLAISYFAPDKPVWNALNNLFISVVASGVFAIVSALYVTYFFVDPNDLRCAIDIAPRRYRPGVEVHRGERAGLQNFCANGQVLPR